MAISTYCSLNRIPPPPPSSSPIAIRGLATPKERSWRNQCVLGLTCAIIGVEIADFAVVERAVAVDSQSPTVFVGVSRWSEKRACQPWRINSLETIVPENLPRPSARRRWEATGFSETAPPVKAALKSGANGCFNL